MQIFVDIANDLIILLGNLIIFSTMLNFKELSRLKKWIVSVSCIVMMTAYALCIYIAELPYIHAAVFCFTIPSLLIFWLVSSIKDARFFLTFCIIDTISLMIAFVTKSLSIMAGGAAPYITLIVNTVLYTCIIACGYKLFLKYARLLKFQKAGWRSMMIASFLIYFALYFFAAYPEPMINRTEYIPSYALFCIVILSCYLVFLNSIIKTKKLYEQNEELEKEKNFHKIAYKDSLTGVYNRVYYVEKINEIERNKERYQNICSIVIDVNNLKSINDLFGHHSGDLALQDIAHQITSIFKDLSSFVFRVGGDEFFILLMDVNPQDIENRLLKINQNLANDHQKRNYTLSIAYGCSFMNTKEELSKYTVEQSFMQADQKMYIYKKQYKTEHPQMEFCNKYGNFTI